MRDDNAATQNASGARAAALRTRLDSFRATRRRGAIGFPEFVALAAAALLLLTAVLAYLFLLVPARSRTYALETERDGLQRLLQSQQNNLGEGRDTEQRVANILSSLERFEVNHLGQASSGSKTVIEELNRLILKNNLRISGGVNFRQLQEAVPGSEGQAARARRPSGGETGQRIEQSIFPGIGVTLTVEGAYPNLRRFIGDIEADRRQFVVINTVELEGVTDSNAAEAPAPAAVPGAEPGIAQPQTPSRNALVSLRLDMAAYFRRAATAAAASQ